MYKVMMIVDGEHYCYGKWADKDVAIRVAVEVSLQRDIETYVDEE